MKVFTTDEETLSQEEAVARIQENPFGQLLVWTESTETWVAWYQLGWLAVAVGRASNVYIHRAEDDADAAPSAIEPREFCSLLESAAPTDIQVWEPGEEAWKPLELVEWISQLFLGSELYYSAAGEEQGLRRWEALARLQEDPGCITHVAISVDGSQDLEWSVVAEHPEHWPHPVEKSSASGQAAGAPASATRGVPALEPSDTNALRPGVAVIETTGPDGTSSEMWLIRGSVFSGGRNDTRSTVLLAIEPFDHPVRDLANREKSMRISSKHLAVQLGDSGLSVTDLNSSNGTCVNDAPLVPLVPATVSTGDVVEIGQVLQLNCDVRTDASGVVQAAVLRRVGNREERRYVIGAGGVGCEMGALSSLGPLADGQEGVGWRLVWTTRGLRVDIASDCRDRVSVATSGAPREGDADGPWWLSTGGAVVVDGEVAVSIQHVSH